MSSRCFREISWSDTTTSLKTEKGSNIPDLRNIAHWYRSVLKIRSWSDSQFNMVAFTATLQYHKDKRAHDMFHTSFTFTNFLAFRNISRWQSRKTKARE
jgi:hypothetical protein